MNIERSVTLSNDGLYRYDLTRRWSAGSTVCFIGLNPSTADDTVDDPTIRRCISFAQRWGHARLVMLNAYAFRSTSPGLLKTIPDPIGPLNDEYLSIWIPLCDVVVAAWGTNINMDRQNEILNKFSNLSYLRLTKNGFPNHPLYLPKHLSPIEWVGY